MRHYLIATHGTLSEGFYNALKIIVAIDMPIYIITAYIDQSDLKKEIEKTIYSIPKDDELIVMTDVFGGSVNNTFMEYVNKKNIYLVSGVNLALVISIVLNKELDTHKMLHNCVEEARKTIVYCNELKRPAEFDDF